MLVPKTKKMQTESPVAARIVLGMAVVMAISIPVALILKDARELALLEKTAKSTRGQVTRKNCANHGKVVYSYTVNGRIYNGSGTLDGKYCTDVKIGDHIEIVYSEENPKLSRSDSMELWRSSIYGSLFALALLTLAALIGMFHITRVDADA